MTLDSNDLQELKIIHRRYFHEELSDHEASEMGIRLIRLLELFEQIDDADAKCLEGIEVKEI